jgi:hypothetical protein
MLTEEEAKNRWCPLTAGADPEDERGRSCIASQCMAWRWVLDYSDGEPRQTDKGYCGLAD